MQNESLRVIADPSTPIPLLESAIDGLGSVDEPPTFWSAIANSDRYNDDSRRRAVFALFRRHIRPSTTLAQLVNVLDKPTWLDSSSIAIVNEVGGEAPVVINQNDTVFVLPVFSNRPDERQSRWAVYLRVEGDVDVVTFTALLSGRDTTMNIMSRRVLEQGFSPNPPRSLHARGGA